MSYGRLLHSVPDGLRTLVRNYENINKKLINIKWSLEFNSICLKEDMLPQYSNIQHRDPALPITEATTKYRKHLIEQEIEKKKVQEIELMCSKKQCKRDIETYDCNSDLKNISYDCP